MPLPRALARFNRVATNRVAMLVVGWLPGFAIIEHVGRRTGRTYRTPVSVFRNGDIVTVALTYGPGADWLRNVLAAGGCLAETRGVRLRLREPRVVRDEARRAVAWPVRQVLRALRAADFLELRIEAEGRERA
jgi:deazaflavin-dependent oxidoreductase (nitroreductase family)